MRRGVAAALAGAAFAAAGCEQILGIHDLTERPPADVDLVIEPGGTQDFGEVIMGTVSAPVPVTIRNRGTAPSAEVTVALEGDDTDAYVLAADSCNRVLAPDDSCTAELRFRPTRSASQVASMRAADSAGVEAELSLLGVGLVPLVALPSDLPFGNVLVGEVSVAVEVQVINTGGLVARDVTASVTSTTHFSIVSGQNECQDAELDPGESCSLQVQFHPMTAGDQMTGLLVSAAPFGTLNTALTGTGLAPGDIEIDPTAHDFGPQGIRTTSSGFNFTVTNNGGTTGTLTTAISNGVFVKDDGCNGVTLNNNSTCTIQVTFDPQVAGPAVGSLTVFEGTTPVTAASLSGTGTANLRVNRSGNGGGTVTSAPAGIDCGTQCNVDFSVAQVTLTATADAGSTFTGWSGGGASACGGSSISCVVPMDQAQIVTATFDAAVTQLTIQVGGNGEGEVTSPTHPTIHCSNTGGSGAEVCDIQLSPGTDVRLDAFAEPGSEFGGWCGVCIDAGINPTCELTVNTSVNVQAYFCPQVGPPCPIGC